MFKILTVKRTVLLIIVFYVLFSFKWDNDILSKSAIAPSDIVSIEIFLDANLSHSSKKALITNSVQIEHIYNYIEDLPKLRVPIPNLVGVGGSTTVDIVILLDNNSSVILYITNAWTTTLYYNQKYYKLPNDNIFDYLEEIICNTSLTPITHNLLSFSSAGR